MSPFEAVALVDNLPPLPVFLSTWGHLGGLSWEDRILAYDFGLLAPGELLAWLDPCDLAHAEVQDLVQRGTRGEPDFEAALWRTCKDLSGRLPRPGSQGWDRAQDRWRAAFLKEVLRMTPDPVLRGTMVQAVYERLGFPEDMRGLWTLRDGQPVANEAAIERALARWLEVPSGRSLPLTA